MTEFAAWLAASPESPVAGKTAYTAEDQDRSGFDIKVIYQQPHDEVALRNVPPVYMPRIGPMGLIDYDGVFAVTPDDDIFEQRGIDRAGALVVVRPDQYVAHVLPLAASDRLAAFIDGFSPPAKA